MKLKTLLKKPRLLITIITLLIMGSSSSNPYSSYNDPYVMNHYVLKKLTPIENMEYLDRNFLGVNLDSSQVFGGMWWEGSNELINGLGGTEVNELDLTNPDLLRYAKALNPAYLRIGGSEADNIYYDLSDDPLTINELPHSFDLLLDKERLMEIRNFLEEIESSLLFTVNAGPGPRLLLKQQNSTYPNWSSENARNLITYMSDLDFPMLAWEFGNEPNAYPFVHGVQWRISGEQYANDFARFAEMVKSIDPDYSVVGPATAHWPLFGEGFSVAKDFYYSTSVDPDASTFHYYPQQSDRGILRSRPAEPLTLLNEYFLDDVLYTVEAFKAYHEKNNINAPIWLGETGNAQFGGQDGVSNTFISSLWWIDLLALSAHNGIKKIFRQTLVGSEYGLLDYNSFEPMPDYWTTYLWQTIIEGFPSKVTLMQKNNLFYFEKHDLIRAYGFETDQDFSIILINLNQEIPAIFDLNQISTETKYLVVSSDDPWGRTLTWNDEMPKLIEDVQDLPWNHLENKIFELPPLSYVILSGPLDNWT